MKIPDGMGLFLEYEYILDLNYAGDIKVSNEVTLNGEWSHKDDTVLKEISSSATASKKLVKIYKVDEDNFKKFLPGTEFKLEYWDKDNNIWKTKIEKIEVDKDGYMQWGLSGEDRFLESDTLYRLVETKPVEGYKITEENTYMIWLGEHDNFSQAYNNSGAFLSGVSSDKIVRIANGGGIHYITNKYTRLTVNKIWQDFQGNVVIGPKDKDVNISLYRHIKKPDGYKVRVILKSTAQWGIDDKEYTVIVNKSTGKGITINFNGWMDNPQYEYDGNIGKLPSINSTLTIPSITKDTVVTITHGNNHVQPVFSEYDKPDVKIEKSFVEKINLNSGNSWSKSWDNLAYNDKEGNPYYYTVEEDDVEGYLTSYTNNEGIQYGDINVINTEVEIKITEYPKAGGGGALLFRIIGFLIFCSGIILNYKNKISKI